jgi:type VI secretion system protein ImpH
MTSTEREGAEQATGWLVAAARKMGFVQLVAFLERLTPSAVPVGTQGPPDREAVVFRHDPSLVFSAGDVSSLRFEKASDPEQRPFFEVTTTFLGLTGSATPLPHYLAEEVAQEQGNDGHPRRDFLDLFHHRLLSLLYRALTKYSVTQEAQNDGGDAWARRTLALGGLDALGDRPLPPIPLPTLLRLAPLLALRSRTASSLELALRDALGEELDGADIKVEQFVEDWVPINERTRLGKEFHRLGHNAVLGARAPDRAGKVRLVLGPLSRPTYPRFLPDGDLLPRVHAVVQLFGWDPLAYELELRVAPGAAPELRLNSRPPFYAALGRDAWLCETELREHVSRRQLDAR